MTSLTPDRNTNQQQQPTTNNTPWPCWLKIANAQIEKCSQVLWVVRTNFSRRFHQRQWWSTSRQLQPCTRRLHAWMSTSRLLLPCLRRRRQWMSTSSPLLPCTRQQHKWSTSRPRLLCFKRQRQVRSLSRLQPVHSFFFSLSLSPASSDAETHFPTVTGTKSRRLIETPTCSLARRRHVDEAGHELDVQVERVMCASVARLGYEWRRTKKERNSWRGLCCISVMSYSRAQVMGIR